MAVVETTAVSTGAGSDGAPMLAASSDVRREELRRLLARDGVLFASADQPIRHANGAAAPWALYTPAVSLTGPGLRLAGEVLLERLASFASTQLAAYGHTAQPLMAACVLLGDGRYTGLSVRTKPKPSVTMRQVDGPLDRSRSVVVVDDSMVSGRSLESAVRALESNGFEVEGTLTLVQFPNRGGVDWAWSKGYRVESIFDVWTDLGRAGQPFRPDEGFDPGLDRSQAVPDGLPLASAARWIAEAYVTTGRVPAAPASFDATFEAPGGVFVSFRRRADDHRVARDGFWKFRGLPTSLGEDLVFATVRTIQLARGAVHRGNLGELKIGVTLAGPVEEIKPADLDFDRYGIVVRDRVNGRKLGGALPNTQVYTAEAGQYFQARVRNAQLAHGEDHQLFRHDITKVVEPGETWLSYGAPDGPDLAWRTDQTVGGQLTEQAWAACRRAAQGEGQATPASGLASQITTRIEGVAIGLYANGYLASGLADRPDHPDLRLEELIGEAAERAVRDLPDATRTELAGDVTAERISLVVTVLHDREDLGESAPLARFKVRPGIDALSVRSSTGSQTLLPAVGPYNGWNGDELVRRLQQTRTGATPGARWSTCRTASWVRTVPPGSGVVVRRTEFGFTAQPRDAPPQPRSLLEPMAEHVLRRIGRSGLPAYEINAVTGERTVVGTTPRVVHALASLAEAGRILGRPDMVEAARTGLQVCLNRVGSGGVRGELALPGYRHGGLADCVLLDAALRDPELRDHPAVDAIGRRLAGHLGRLGRIATSPSRVDDGQDHTFLPGGILMAVGPWLAARGAALPEHRFGPQLRWHREQFRATTSWALVGWHPQGWNAVHAIEPRADIAGYVFELADWAIDRQLKKNGAFLDDFSDTEPSFDTGFIAEGIAAAWAVAIRAGDDERSERYRASWEGAMAFAASLVFKPEDSFASRAPDDMVGGVRLTPSSASLRIDATSHCLHALTSGLRLLETG
jgi:AMMECR1 domain-containing protein